ncbi:MAG: fumarylacetoacetate hydrolase family protein [Syntrophotalea acetylenica]|jgi:5-carboxymethyl-2-hydroxymuconate isomerase|uniref:Acylpyruvase n=1 Tax=Syntrophotalea acetylenica TaxID=29542 RepID=A0A1L3GEC3_SYNAC|nr:fumarylacetoacetate hydrolase family protein [Syntrophotalea acetylenica]APG24301.1 acylpyruvase [Syntrophotalea acetylenica]APG44883.1 acylpyruvase [Syntrophotalea acetylenica]MDD4457194.1 fumarylacetoacetate hydrolase family protein [Syntrophotalea acetylenica]MDY0262597.1 fumarylacetoacetate hydrolase family protein [Syntrophotalea acetylenica]
MHTVRLLDDTLFQVGKILCVARNYRSHADELGNEPPNEPVFFLKPSSSIIGPRENAVIPPYSRLCHHEIELAVLIGKWGRNIPEAEAMNHVAGYGVAIDLTLRDVQQRLKAQGLPWDQAKGFDTSCPLSDFVPAGQVPDPHALRLTLSVNGETRQDGNTAEMIFKIPALISAASAIFTLEKGDILLTGTPAGVGPVVQGDQICAEIEGVNWLNIGIQ